jgi:hypothetical protein
MEENLRFIILIFLNISLPISLLEIPFLFPAIINFFCFDLFIEDIVNLYYLIDLKNIFFLLSSFFITQSTKFYL